MALFFISLLLFHPIRYPKTDALDRVTVTRRRRPIIVLLSGGLGNQLFQYAACRALAQRLGCALELDRRFYLSSDAYPNAFDRAFRLDRFPVRATNRALPAPLAGHGPLARLYRKFWEERVHAVYRSDLVGFDCAFLRVGAGTIVSAYLQSHRYFEGHEAEIRRDLACDGLLDPEGEEQAAHIDASRSVFVHVRRGDYATHVDLELPGMPRYYAQAMAIVRAEVPGARFHVISDDPEWCRSSGLFDGDDVTVVGFTNSARATERDLVLMTRCRHGIVANSSFSWWGAWLGREEERLVIAPARWTREVDTARADVVPAHWRLVDIW